MTFLVLSTVLSEHLFAENASSKIYHVRADMPNGDGSEQHPFASIQAAVDKARPGDTIRVGPGIFHEVVQIRKSGRENAPIVIQGTKGEHGEHLTIIDGGELISPEGWIPAPEVAHGVYRNTTPASHVNFLSINGRLVAPISHAAGLGSAREATAMEVLAWPQDKDYVSTQHLKVKVPVWKTLGAVYHSDPKTDTIWLRFANGDHPRSHEIRASSAHTVVSIDQASHIVLRGLVIRGGLNAVFIGGEQARFNLVDDCHMACANTRLHLTQGASYNRITGCRFTMDFFGAAPGPWIYSSNSAGNKQELGAHEYLYIYFKFYASGRRISDDRSLLINDGANNNTLENSLLSGGLVGVQTSNTAKLTVEGNRFEHFSSVGAVIREGSIDIDLDRNTFEDCNINIRLHNLNVHGGHRVYLHRNRSLLPPGVGMHLFCHSLEEGNDFTDPEIFIYDNLFIGGQSGLTLPRAPDFLERGVPRFVVVNNLFAKCGVPLQSKPSISARKEMFGAFEHNWIIGGVIRDGIPTWLGPSNRVETADSKDSPIGIDFSKDFTLNGVNFPALPAYY